MVSFTQNFKKNAQYLEKNKIEPKTYTFSEKNDTISKIAKHNQCINSSITSYKKQWIYETKKCVVNN